MSYSNDNKNYKEIQAVAWIIGVALVCSAAVALSASAVSFLIWLVCLAVIGSFCVYAYLLQGEK